MDEGGRTDQNYTPEPDSNNSAKEGSNGSDGTVKKLDLLHLCFSLNFYFLMFLSQFPSLFLLLNYSQSLIPLPADYTRHSR